MVITVSTMVEDSETGILSSADTIISLNSFFSSLKHHCNLNLGSTIAAVYEEPKRTISQIPSSLSNFEMSSNSSEPHLSETCSHMVKRSQI